MLDGCRPGRCSALEVLADGLAGTCAANMPQAMCRPTLPCDNASCAGRPGALCLPNYCYRWLR